MYQTVRHEAEISAADYFQNYVDLTMLGVSCGDCPNFNHVWSCPMHDFDVADFWSRYQTLRLSAVQIIFSPELRSEVTTEDEFNTVMEQIVAPEVMKLAQELYCSEQEHPGSRSLAPGGACQLCPGGCSKPEGKPCRQPERMRQSLEALGGNVIKTAEELLKLPLLWPDLWQLPEYLVFTGGLLLGKETP